MSRADAAEDRARARKAYRQFRLPALYHWRRALAVLVVLALAIGSVGLIGPHPRQWLLDRWHDLRGTAVPVVVTGIQASPKSASTADSRPDNLIDGTRAMWTIDWPVRKPAESCHAPGGPRVTLSFNPTRVKNLVIYAGAPADQPDRLQRFRPRTISYSVDGGPCRTAELNATGEAETVMVDSDVPVSSLELVVVDAYQPPPDGAQPTLSISEISLAARP